MKNLVVVGVALVALAGCGAANLADRAYWQRVEDSSALWMTGPKAQQELEQNIASCVREIDEMVNLGALRETTPPDTHSEYRKPLDASGDLAHFDTPTRLGSHKVSHTDYHDFEGCMRFKGWERVQYVRYQTSTKAAQTYQDTKDIRQWGVYGEMARQKREAAAANTMSHTVELNK
jgi:hypothetical protein